MIPCPKVDQRSAEEIAAQLRTLLSFYVPGLRSGEGGNQVVEAMTRIFARYGELMIDRMNRAPERNYLAFLNLVGVSPLPPRAARVPLTFYLSNPTAEVVVVPARTQVAAELAKGETTPVIFETESELVVVAAKLQSLFFKDGGLDRYRDWGAAIGPATPPESRPLPDVSTTPSKSEVQLLPHWMFLGMPWRARWPQSNQLALRFNLEENMPPFPDARSVQWELCEPISTPAKSAKGAETGASFEKSIRRTPLTPEVDETNGLAKSGQVLFVNLPQPNPVNLEGFSGFWICCRLLTALSRPGEHTPGIVRDQHIPRVLEVTVHSEFAEQNVPVDFIFANGVGVDASKGFFPFGERPKFGDTLYLASEGFSVPDAELTVQIELINPYDSTDSPISPVAKRNAKLVWEYWNGQEWISLGVGDSTAQQSRRQVRFLLETPAAAQESKFVDTTQAFTQSGIVNFRFDAPPVHCAVNGKIAYWVRVRIVSGDYGRDAFYELNSETGKYVVTPPSFAPPSIRSIKVEYAVNAESPVTAVVTFNDFVVRKIGLGETFQPFVLTADSDLLPSFYLGFIPPAAASPLPVPDGSDKPSSAFSTRSMSLFAGMGEATEVARQVSDDGSSAPLSNWEYWNGSAWKKWTIRDGTQGFERSGIIRALAPPDFQMSREFGLDRCWLRMRKGVSSFDPVFKHVLLNTTMAREGATLLGEILGTANGQPNQTLRTVRAPVLSGQQLEVREPYMPSKEEQSIITAEEGVDAIHGAPTAGEAGGHVWVRWHEVPNFDGSGPRHRHYMFDWLTGEVQFGDGINGQVPPALPQNVRMAFYRTGGGARGNKPSLTIKQLKSAVPYIGKVLNWEEAGGGGDSESTSDLMDRGPRFLRHGNRAVAAEDFEDIARMSSSQVARARCFPLRDLQNKREQRKQPGVVSVIIVPRSTDPAPKPSQELLDSVKDSLSNSCSPLVRLVLVGPEYVAVDVETEITVDDPDAAAEIELAATLALQSYLHPVSGGRDGAGWEFGREPRKSDLLALLEEIPGVSHVRGLNIQLRHPPAVEVNPAQYLICGGSHKIETTLEE